MDTIKLTNTVFTKGQIPASSLPEIVLCGRSNVGKSSFINSFFGLRSLAKVSSTPGKTRSLNYYLINDRYYLVDLPGFGYARVSFSERDKWQQLIKDYFASVRNVSFILHIIDAKAGMTNLDVQLQEFVAGSGFPYKLLANKCDKLNQSETGKLLTALKNSNPQLDPSTDIYLYSARTGKGKKQVLNLFRDIQF